MEKWRILSSKPAFDNKWFRVRQDTVQLPNGKILDDYYLWLVGNISLVVPVTENNEFILVRQYKHGAGDIIVEFPAGHVDESEEPEAAARRELIEETGYTSDRFSSLGVCTNSPTKAVEKIHIFLATDVRHVAEQHLDENEQIEVLTVPWQETREMVRRGDIWVTSSVAAVFLAIEKLCLQDSVK